MSLLSTLLLSCLLHLTFSQTPTFTSESWYLVDTCITNNDTGIFNDQSLKYKCATVNGYDAVRAYQYDGLNCQNEGYHDESSYYSGTTYGGCDQDSTDLYIVSDCTAAQDNVAIANGVECGYFQISTFSSVLPINQCRLDDTCSVDGNSCIDVVDTSDGNVTLIENGFDSYDCTGNVTDSDFWDLSEVEKLQNGIRNCHVKVVRYDFSGTNQFCNYESRFGGPSGIITDPVYYYDDSTSTFISADEGLISNVQPKVIGECYGRREGYKEYSWMYTCDADNSQVVKTYYFDSMDCDSENMEVVSWHSYSAVDYYGTCGLESKTPKGSYDSKESFIRTLNNNADLRSGALGCKACYHYYADYEDRPYTEQNLMVVRSTTNGNKFMTHDWYFNGTCNDEPLVTHFQTLDSFSYPYPKYFFSGCQNPKAKVSKKRIKKYYSGASSYFSYN